MSAQEAKGRLALLSVSDKRGLVEFAQGLKELGFTLVSTGGTAKALTEAGLKVTKVESLTGFPEMLDGRVKTLHPAVHAALLADLRREPHRRALTKAGYRPISLLAVNLYPFAEAAEREADPEAVIEQIDIGGPSMLRSAAKNWANVAVVCRPDSYPAVLEKLREGDGNLDEETRRSLAAEAFAHTAAYDSRIAQWFGEQDPSTAAPAQLSLAGDLISELRYGENPHQRAALYAWSGQPARGLAGARLLQGEALSYNNLLDLDCALSCSLAIEGPAATLVKHVTPCGVATAPDLKAAYLMAREADRESAFGGVVGLNRPCDAATASELVKTFLEVVAFPGLSKQAAEILKTKPRMRVVEMPDAGKPPPWAPRAVAGGILVQTPDDPSLQEAKWEVATRRAPTDDEIAGLRLAWLVAAYVRSNAIVLVRADGEGWRTTGVGPGQTSRVESVRAALRRAGEAASRSVLASDGFFPQADGVRVAGTAGVSALVQPGGSKKDSEVVAAADELGLAMILTGVRHFRH